MGPRGLASGALVGALVAWLLRGAVMAWLTGPFQAPLEVTLFVLGLLLYLGGSVAAGVSMAPEPTAGPLVLWGFVGFAVASLVFWLAEAVTSLVAPSNAGWAWGEAPLWLAAGFGVILWLSVQDGLDAA